MIWFFSIYFLAVFLIPIGVGAVVSYRALPMGRECPRCGTATSLLRSAWARTLSAAPGIRVQRRWCLSCGWSGLLRTGHASVRLVIARQADAARIIDLRPLLVDGVWWRVRLETWKARDTWFGRLVFVEPSGRIWPDARLLRSGSDADLVAQARRIPAGLLASTLRNVVSS